MNTATLGAFSAIDWRGVAAVLGIITAALLLVYWNTRQDSYRAAKWLSHSALSLELLGLALSLFWAVNAPDGVILPWIFCAGWIGMLIGRAVLISYVVTEWQRGNHGRAFGGILTLLLAYTALYGSGLFHAVNDAGIAAQARLEQSKPAQALDAEIDATRARIAALAGFSDADKAHTETMQQQAAQADMSTKRTALQSELASRQAELATCPKNHITRCIKPTQAEIARIQAQLSGLGSGVAGSDYAARHDEYNGLQLHLVELQKQRAALSASGQGIQDAWKAEDNMLSWLFGITPEQASRIKWLIATLIFDVLSLLFRVFAALQLGTANPETMQRRKLEALLHGGFDFSEALGIMAGNTAQSIPPAKVKLNEPIPALDVGGEILNDGLALVHAGERVLTASETAEYNAWRAQQQHQQHADMQTHTQTQSPVKKAVGAVYQCVTCGHDYKARTVWQKYCPDCGQEKRSKYAKRKSA